jgi:hypothetical protein
MNIWTIDIFAADFVSQRILTSDDKACGQVLLVKYNGDRAVRFAAGRAMKEH